MLDQVIVGPRLEPINAIIDPAHSGEIRSPGLDAAARSARSSDRPSSPGSIRSITSTSYWAWAAWLSASRPSFEHFGKVTASEKPLTT